MPGLIAAIEAIKKAGGRVINGTELPNYKTFVAPNGWDWYGSISQSCCLLLVAQCHARDYGTTRGFPNESEYTVVKVRSLFAP